MLTREKANLFPVLAVSCFLLATALTAAWFYHTRPLPGRDLEEIKKSGRLKVVLAYDPINYFIYRGAPMGYSYELARSFAEELGVTLEVLSVRDLDHQIPLLKSGDGDLIAHSITIIDNRQQNVDFSDPIDSTRQVLIQKLPDTPGDSTGLVRFPQQFNGKTVYVRESSAYYHTLKKYRERFGLSLNIMKADGSLSTGELIRQVNDGWIGFTVADDNIAVSYKEHYPGIDIATVISKKLPLAWVVRKSSPKLRAALNSWIERQKRSGYLQVLHNKYYEQQYRFGKHAFTSFYSEAAGKISPYDPLVKVAAETIGWDWRLLASLIYEESQFDPQAVSWAGAKGLMQLMPTTAAGFTKKTDLSDPLENIRAGTAYIGMLEKEWMDIRDPETKMKFVIASYNAGPGHVQDARRLAQKYGADPNLWEDNVAKYLTLKSEPAYYNDPVSLSGYCNGSGAVRYTRNILDRYRLYTQVFTK